MKISLRDTPPPLGIAGFIAGMNAAIALTHTRWFNIITLILIAAYTLYLSYQNWVQHRTMYLVIKEHALKEHILKEMGEAS